MTLGETIQYYRKRAGLSQEALAELAGVSRQAVSKWELGDATPEVDKLLALAKAFGVTTDELLSEAEPARAQGEAPPQGQPADHTVPTASPVDPFDKATGFLGRMVQRYGWIFGVRIALSGLGLTIIGVLARWGFGAMFQTSQSMMSGIGGFGGMGGVTFSGDVPPGLQQEILGELGYATASPLGGDGGLFPGLCHRIPGPRGADHDRWCGPGGIPLPKGEQKVLSRRVRGTHCAYFKESQRSIAGTGPPNGVLRDAGQALRQKDS